MVFLMYWVIEFTLLGNTTIWDNISKNTPAWKKKLNHNLEIKTDVKPGEEKDYL